MTRILCHAKNNTLLYAKKTLTFDKKTFSCDQTILLYDVSHDVLNNCFRSKSTIKIYISLVKDYICCVVACQLCIGCYQHLSCPSCPGCFPCPGSTILSFSTPQSFSSMPCLEGLYSTNEGHHAKGTSKESTE